MVSFLNMIYLFEIPCHQCDNNDLIQKLIRRLAVKEQNYNAFQLHKNNLTIQKNIDLEPAARALLREPGKEIHITIPVKWDNGTTQVFKGFRIHHNDARGSIKVGLDSIQKKLLIPLGALSMWMTWKCAVTLILPLGGGKGGVISDPREMSLGEQERLCRRDMLESYLKMWVQLST